MVFLYTFQSDSLQKEGDGLLSRDTTEHSHLLKETQFHPDEGQNGVTLTGLGQREEKCQKKTPERTPMSKDKEETKISEYVETPQSYQ